MGIKQGTYCQRAIHAILRRTALLWPDELYLKVFYFSYMGKKLDLNNPKSFSEKLQWLKLHDRNPRYTSLVDKYLVKDIVAKIIGTDYITPTLGAWNYAEDIDFGSLPNKFVLKTNHSGGNTGVILCKDKAHFNKKEAISKLNKSLHDRGIFPFHREWPYMNVNRKIIAEQFLESSDGSDIVDYKFYCFDGYADCVLTCIDRQYNDTKYYFFDKNWELKRYNKWGAEAPNGFKLPKPANLDKMFDIASKLSEGFPFARIDLFNVDGKIYFGEITFYPASGVNYNLLPQADSFFGSLLSFDKAFDKK